MQWAVMQLPLSSSMHREHALLPLLVVLAKANHAERTHAPGL